jgi:hypothetical protein
LTSRRVALHAVNPLPFLPLGVVALRRLGLRASELRDAAEAGLEA